MAALKWFSAKHRVHNNISMKMYTKVFVFIVLCLSAIVAYYAWHISFKRLSAEISIEHWAEHLIAQEGIGRNCSVVNQEDINDIFDAAGRKRLENDADLNLPTLCWKEMQLIEMAYYAKYNVTSGVYRCENNDRIQELRLAIYMEPRTVPQESDCKIGSFPKAWGIPVGEATMFSLP